MNDESAEIYWSERSRWILCHSGTITLTLIKLRRPNVLNPLRGNTMTKRNETLQKRVRLNGSGMLHGASRLTRERRGI